MIRNSFPSTFLIIIFLLLPFSILAQHSISGYVTDTAGSPLPGATIWIPQAETGTATDLSGRFEFTDLEDGSLTLVIRFVGYKPTEHQIYLPDAAAEPVRITMQEIVYLTDELLVVGTLFDRITRYQPTQSYSAGEIQQRNTSSIGTLLDGESGVAMRSMGNAPARPVVRGMDGERIQVLQNGMKMGDFSSTGADHAVILDPATIERVDIVRGPASLIYGSSAMGGIVNVHSADIPSGWTAGTSGYFGTEGQTGMESLSGLARFTYGTEDRALTFRSSLRNTGNMKTPAGEIPGTDLMSLHLGGGGAWRYDSGYSGFSLQYCDKKYGIPDDLFVQDEEVELAMQRFALQGVSHHRLDHGFWEAAEARLVYNYYTHEENEYGFSDGVLEDKSLELAIDHHFLQTDLLFQHTERGVIDNGTAGLTLAWRDVAVGGDEALTPDARGWTVAGFLIEEIALYRNWNVQTGVRLEWNHLRSVANEDYPEAGRTRSQGIWAGSAGVSGPVFGNARLGFQLSRSHRTPSLEELFADAIHFAAGAYEMGNPDLDDEVGYGLDVFLDYQSGSWDLHMALFANRIANYITLRPTGQFEPTRGYPILEYYGSDAELLGGEISARRKLSNRLDIKLGADYIHGSEMSDGTREPLPFMPPLRLSAESTYDTSRWWTGVRVRHAFTQDRTAEAEAETNGYTLTDFSAGARLGAANLHQIIITAENLFDVTWRDHLSRIEQRDIPMMGRNIRLSYRYYF